MSVYIRASSKRRELNKIKERVGYVYDPQKTKEEFSHALGVSKKRAYEDFLLVKQIHRKTDGLQYLHWILSFDKDADIEAANQAGKEVLYLLDGTYQAIAAMHLNTDNLHFHYLINPVDIKTGKKFSEGHGAMKAFCKKVNVILKKYGLSEIGEAVIKKEDEFDEQDNIISENGYFKRYEIAEGKLYCGRGYCDDDECYEPGLLYEEREFYLENSMFTTLEDAEKSSCVQVSYKENANVVSVMDKKVERPLIRGVTYDIKPLIPGLIYLDKPIPGITYDKENNFMKGQENEKK